MEQSGPHLTAMSRKGGWYDQEDDYYDDDYDDDDGGGDGFGAYDTGSLAPKPKGGAGKGSKAAGALSARAGGPKAATNVGTPNPARP